METETTPESFLHGFLGIIVILAGACILYFICQSLPEGVRRYLFEVCMALTG